MDDVELAMAIPATEAWGCELEDLAEEGLAQCPSPQAQPLSLGWDDELQKPGAQAYMHFMQEHTCYDAMATSSKLVIFDTTLEVRPQLHPALSGSHLKAPPRSPSWHQKDRKGIFQLSRSMS